VNKTIILTVSQGHPCIVISLALKIYMLWTKGGAQLKEQ